MLHHNWFVVCYNCYSFMLYQDFLFCCNVFSHFCCSKTNLFCINTTSLCCIKICPLLPFFHWPTQWEVIIACSSLRPYYSTRGVFNFELERFFCFHVKEDVHKSNLVFTGWTWCSPGEHCNIFLENSSIPNCHIIFHHFSSRIQEVTFPQVLFWLK